MRRRGFTLIELMVALAILSITAAVAGVTSGRARELGRAELQREQALLLLEYEATCLSRGEPVDAAVEDRLLAPLPDAALTRRHEAGAATLALSWRDPLGRSVSRSMTVFVRGAGP